MLWISIRAGVYGLAPLLVGIAFGLEPDPGMLLVPLIGFVTGFGFASFGVTVAGSDAANPTAAAGEGGATDVTPTAVATSGAGGLGSALPVGPTTAAGGGGGASTAVPPQRAGGGGATSAVPSGGTPTGAASASKAGGPNTASDRGVTPSRTQSTPCCIVRTICAVVVIGPYAVAPCARAIPAMSISGSEMRCPIQRFSRGRPREAATRS